MIRADLDAIAILKEYESAGASFCHLGLDRQQIFRGQSISLAAGQSRNHPAGFAQRFLLSTNIRSTRPEPLALMQFYSLLQYYPMMP